MGPIAIPFAADGSVVRKTVEELRRREHLHIGERRLHQVRVARHQTIGAGLAGQSNKVIVVRVGHDPRFHHRVLGQLCLSPETLHKLDDDSAAEKLELWAGQHLLEFRQELRANDGLERPPVEPRVQDRSGRAARQQAGNDDVWVEDGPYRRRRARTARNSSLATAIASSSVRRASALAWSIVARRGLLYSFQAAWRVTRSYRGPGRPASSCRAPRLTRNTLLTERGIQLRLAPRRWVGRPSTRPERKPLFEAEQRILAVDDLANPLHKSEPLRARTLPNVPADEYASETYFEGSPYSLHDIRTATT
jgi:hypothetical protein